MQTQEEPGQSGDCILNENSIFIVHSSCASSAASPYPRARPSYPTLVNRSLCALCQGTGTKRQGERQRDSETEGGRRGHSERHPPPALPLPGMCSAAECSRLQASTVSTSPSLEISRMALKALILATRWRRSLWMDARPLAPC